MVLLVEQHPQQLKALEGNALKAMWKLMYVTMILEAWTVTVTFNFTSAMADKFDESTQVRALSFITISYSFNP